MRAICLLLAAALFCVACATQPGQDIVQAEPMRFPTESQTQIAQNGKYVVQAGDTLSSIAQKLDMKTADLEARNPGVDWIKLKIGQEIVFEPPAQ